MAAQIIQVVARLALHTLHILLRNRYAHTPQPGLGFAQAADEAQLLRVLGGAVLGFEFAQEVVGYGWDGGHGASSPKALAMAALPFSTTLCKRFISRSSRTSTAHCRASSNSGAAAIRRASSSVPTHAKYLSEPSKIR